MEPVVLQCRAHAAGEPGANSKQISVLRSRRARGRGERTTPVRTKTDERGSRPRVWGPDGEQGVTLTGSTADGIVVTRTTGAVSGSLRDTEHAYFQ